MLSTNPARNTVRSPVPNNSAVPPTTDNSAVLLTTLKKKGKQVDETPAPKKTEFEMAFAKFKKGKSGGGVEKNLYDTPLGRANPTLMSHDILDGKAGFATLGFSAQETEGDTDHLNFASTLWLDNKMVTLYEIPVTCQLCRFGEYCADVGKNEDGKDTAAPVHRSDLSYAKGIGKPQLVLDTRPGTDPSLRIKLEIPVLLGLKQPSTTPSTMPSSVNPAPPPKPVIAPKPALAPKPSKP